MGLKIDLGRAVWPSLMAILMGACWTGCTKKASEEGGRAQRAKSSYEADLFQERKTKDNLFRTGSQSPIPPGERADFQGLNYYPPDPGLRFQVTLERYPLPRMIRIATNTGEIRSGLRYGLFDFAVDGQACRLHVYRMEDSPEQGPPLLFIPFKDATSGSETYGAGRYIEMRENTSGIYDLDFNRAFNPYCAYNGGYSCPVPPDENRLRVAVRAGEKNYGH